MGKALKGLTPEETSILETLLKKVRDSGKADHRFDFNINLAEGKLREKKLEGLLRGKIEVKTDFKVGETGNLAFEVAYRGRPSGVYKTEANSFAQVFEGSEYDGDLVILISPERLKRILDVCGWEVNGGDGKQSKIKLLKPSELLMSNSKIEKKREKSNARSRDS
jgi:hypothetical protein